MVTTPDLQSPILMVNLEGWELELQHVLPPTLHQCSGCSHAQGVLRQMGRDKAFQCCAGNTTLIGKATCGFGAPKADHDLAELFGVTDHHKLSLETSGSESGKKMTVFAWQNKCDFLSQWEQAALPLLFHLQKDDSEK